MSGTHGSESVTTGRAVFLHGFTQTHHHWHRCGSMIAQRCGFTSTAYVDLPGHGLSVDDRSDIVTTAGTLRALAGPGTYIGYSMGGRVALLAAADDDTGVVERLVLIGATAGLATDEERADRVRLDTERAEHVQAVGVEAFLDEWLAAPLFATLPEGSGGMEHRRRNTADGLAHSLRFHGTGAQPSLWDRLGDIDVPTLVIAGTLDTKFTEIGRRLVAGLGHADLASIPDAGHAVHLERPEAVTDAIAAWLSATP